MTLEERLNQIIEERDAQIGDLEQKLEDMRLQQDLARYAWQHHKVFDNDEFSRQMPFPRLEMRLQRVSQSEDDWYSVEWIYGIVYKHYADVRGNKLLFIPLSKTTSSGGTGAFESRVRGGMLELPFRDGFHIRADSLALGLPPFIVCREKNICQNILRGDIDTTGMLSSDQVKNEN